MRHPLMLGLLLLLCSASLAAQGAANTIAPGMSRAKVASILGEPATARSVADFTYLFYPNACGRRCGMNDLVVLRRDSVVDAIFRSPSRHYSGTSSSPLSLSKSDARDHDAAPARVAPRPVPNPRLKPPAEANDVRPSIPLHPPVMQPAPSTPPAKRTP